MRDTKALDKFLRQIAHRTADLQAQAIRLLGLDTNGDWAPIDREVGKARRITDSISGHLDDAERELYKLGGKR